jgi:hypothetical protein
VNHHLVTSSDSVPNEQNIQNCEDDMMGQSSPTINGLDGISQIVDDMAFNF